MARNDLFLLDGILDRYITEGIPSQKPDEVFEYFATEQILKDYAFSSDQLLSGSVDGRNDGGIDEFFVLVNGHLAENIPPHFWPKSNAELEAIRKKNQELWSGAMFLSSYNLSEELVENVFHELPPQPWPTNIHQQIAKKLGVTGIIVSNAISYLIYTERVNAQVYGYVFDPEGKIVSESDHYDHTEAEARAKLKEQLSFYERKFEF